MKLTKKRLSFYSFLTVIGLLIVYLTTLFLSLLILARPLSASGAKIKLFKAGAVISRPVIYLNRHLPFTAGYLANSVIQVTPLTYDVLSTGRRWQADWLKGNLEIDKGQLDNFVQKYSRWITDIYSLYQTYSAWQYRGLVDRFIPISARLNQDNLNLLLSSRDVVTNLNWLLALNDNTSRTYYFFIQNNLEIRPTGGFLGSYAKLQVQDGVWQISFHDIYEHDGNLPGHVEPPRPIQKAFKHGFWRLRDANWNYDFNQSAKDIAWFLIQSQAEKPDAIIALNYATINKILDIIGPIKLDEYKLVITSDNVYQALHRPVEANFYPGSRYKPRLISQFGRQLLTVIQKADKAQKKKMIKTILEDLNSRQIFIAFFQPQLNQVIKQLGWGGGIGYQPATIIGDYKDYLYLVEANLGANKLNCCLNRQIEDSVDIDDQFIRHQLKIVYSKNKPAEGSYLAYLQLIMPADAFDFHVNQGRAEVDFDLRDNKDKGLTEVGVWVKLSPDQRISRLDISYALPRPAKLNKYQILIQRQPGFDYVYGLKVYANGKLRFDKQTMIDKDYRWQIDL